MKQRRCSLANLVRWATISGQWNCAKLAFQACPAVSLDLTENEEKRGGEKQDCLNKEGILKEERGEQREERREIVSNRSGTLLFIPHPQISRWSPPFTARTDCPRAQVCWPFRKKIVPHPSSFVPSFSVPGDTIITPQETLLSQPASEPSLLRGAQRELRLPKHVCCLGLSVHRLRISGSFSLSLYYVI